MGELAFAYGLKLGDDMDATRSLASVFRERFGDVPVAGDRILIGDFQITVKELDEHSYIKWLGLKIPNKKQK